MNTKRVHIIFQFALATAKLNDDWRSRDLGAIHLIKYAYLADLAYAKAHDGQTYTGAPWRFFNFGPWAEEVYQEIDTALLAIGAEKRDIPSKYEGDFFRWSIPEISEAEELIDKLDFDWAAKLAVSHAVKKYGQDTEDLLHHVYTTLPMLLAAPGEDLDFTTATTRPAPNPKQEEKAKPLSKGQLKRRKEKLSGVREELERRRRLKQEQRELAAEEHAAPRYDEVFFQGLAALEEIAGGEVQPEEFTCSISSDFWKSKARYDPDLH